jgi:DNA-directed RNA polymerase alpha subunit
MTYPTSFVLSCIESKKLEATQLYGCFVLGNFPKGQALTLANGLRRSLLSQVMGTAICFVEIKGASHEYQSLQGVHECVLDILLNLRQLVLKSSIPCFPSQLAYLHVKGPGIARARDLKTPSFISIVDPNQPIATLSTKGQLHLKVLISCGKAFLNQTSAGQAYENQINLLKQRSWLGIQHQVPSTDYSNSWQRERFVKHKRVKKRRSNEQFQVLVKKIKTSKNEPNKSINFEGLNQKNINQKDQLVLKVKEQTFEREKQQDSKKTQTTYVEQKKLNAKNSFDFDDLSNKINTNQNIGYFPLDAIFAPVTKANYTIESVNMTQEKVYFEVWTNGSLDPRHAIHQAAKALIHLFLPLQLSSKTALLTKPTVVSKKNSEPFSLKTHLAVQKQTQRLNYSPLTLTSPGFTQTLNKIKSIQQTCVELSETNKNKFLQEEQAFNQLIKHYLQTKPNKILQMVKRILKPKTIFLPTKYRVQKTKSSHHFPRQTLGEAVLQLDNKPIEIEFHDVGLFFKSKPKLPDPIKPLFFKLFKPNFLTLPQLKTSKISKKSKKSKISKKSKKSKFKSSVNNESKLKENELNKHNSRFKKLVLKRSFYQFKHKMLFTQIGQLNLADSTYQILKTHDIHTLHQLISISTDHFNQTPSLQKIDLSELKKRITHYVLYSLYTISTKTDVPLSLGVKRVVTKTIDF